MNYAAHSQALHGNERHRPGAEWGAKDTRILIPCRQARRGEIWFCHRFITPTGDAKTVSSEFAAEKLSRPFPWSDMGMSGVLRMPSGAQWTSGTCFLVSKVDAKVIVLCDSRITHLGYAGIIFAVFLLLNRFYFSTPFQLDLQTASRHCLPMKTAMRLGAICISGTIS